MGDSGFLDGRIKIFRGKKSSNTLFFFGSTQTDTSQVTKQTSGTHHKKSRSIFCIKLRWAGVRTRVSLLQVRPGELARDMEQKESTGQSLGLAAVKGFVWRMGGFYFYADYEAPT